MKKVLGIMMALVFAAGIAAYAAGTSSDTGGQSGGSSMSGGSSGTGAESGSQSKSSQGTEMKSGAASTSQMSFKTEKDYLTRRLDKANSRIDQMKKSVDQLSEPQKSQMNVEMAKVEGQRDTVKKMLGEAKDKASLVPVQTAMKDLDKSIMGVNQSMKSAKSTGTQSEKGGASGASGGSQMEQSSGGASGGAAGSKEAFKSEKDQLNKQIDKVNNQIDTLKKDAKNSADKNTANVQVAELEGQRDTVKKMLGEAKTTEELTPVRTELMTLEQRVNEMSSSMKRTKTAGDSSMSASTGSMTMGGATGGGTMTFSYDQRDQFKKTASTKLDSLNRRIDMLKENGKNSPQDVNSNLMPKVDQLYARSNQIRDQIKKVSNVDQAQWNTLREGIEKSLDDLETQLMEDEKIIK